MNDNTQLYMINAKLETLKITLQEEPLTSIVQDIQDDITKLIHENSIKDELNNPVKPIDDEQDRKKEIKELMDKIVEYNGCTYELYNDNIIDSMTIKTESNYLKDLFKDYR